MPLRLLNRGPFLSALQAHRLSHFPLTDKTASHVKNSRHFAQVMTELRIEEDKVLVSFDLSSLFTNIPVTEAIQVICNRLQQDGMLADRTTLSPDRVAELLDRDVPEVNVFQLWGRVL